MGYRWIPFAVGEWYHCFTRGIDKRTTFESEYDCSRFLQLLYLANDTQPIQRDHFYYMQHADIFQRPRKEPLVSIGAYCLMKNHYHLLLEEIVDGGITKFMQKVGTGYTMYFNGKLNRIGNVFVKPFRSKHISDDAHLRKVTQYIHLNPAETFEHGWKRGVVKNMANLEKQLLAYPFSSLPDFHGDQRVERSILSLSALNVLKYRLPKLGSVLKESAEYYAEIEALY